VQVAPLQQSVWVTQGYWPPPELHLHAPEEQYWLQQSLALLHEATPVWPHAPPEAAPELELPPPCDVEPPPVVPQWPLTSQGAPLVVQ
jgi:hypothetical protein